MTGSELLRRRTELGISRDELAEQLGEHVDFIATFEAVPGELPKELARRLEYALACKDQENWLNAAGLPSCPELEPIFAGVEGKGSAELQRRMKLAEEHARSCERCQAREAMVKTLPPLPPVPISGTLRAFVAVGQRVMKLPKVAQSTVIGALIVGALTFVRVVFGFLANPTHPLAALLALGVGTYGGAVGGLTYGLTRPSTERLGRVGDYLTGVICVSAAFLAVAIPLNLFTHDNTFRTKSAWVIGSIVCVFFGLIVGHSGFRRDRV